MKTIEKCCVYTRGSNIFYPKHSHCIELVRMKSGYTIFRSTKEQIQTRQDDLDLFCRFFPEIVKRAQDTNVEIAFRGYTTINGDSLTIIQAQGTVSNLTKFDNYDTRTFLGEYAHLLDYSTNLYIKTTSLSTHYNNVLEFCPHKISTLRSIEKYQFLKDKMTHPWAEWERGYCFRNEEDKVLAAMLVL